MAESGLLGGLGMSLRPNWNVSVWLFATGLISFVMSVLIWLRLAGSPKHVILSLVGISFIARGVLYIALARMIRSGARLPPAGIERGKSELEGQA
jgi:uncharacterized membrane protein HdeD (DUF308 family)